MCDRFRKAQIENFKKGRDLAVREANEPRLIDRPEVIKTVYHVQPDEGRVCQVGETLRALLPDLDGPVVLARGFERIGTVEGEGGRVLKTALAEPSSPSIAELRVLSICDISGEATAEMVGLPN